MANVLVPIWIGNDAPGFLQLGCARPVLILVDALSASLGGELLELKPNCATIEPDTPFLLQPNVQMEVRFRFQETVFSFTGLSQPNSHGKSICIQFDQVTRRRMLVLARTFGDVGLLKPGESAAAFEPETPKPGEPAQSTKSVKLSARKFRREQPPDGVERRVDARHELESEAMLTLLDRGVMVPCMLIEISRSGCRVYCDSPVDLELGARVEIEFVGRGFPIRLVLVVEKDHGDKVFGLKTIPVVGRTRDRLLELDSELRQNEMF